MCLFIPSFFLCRRRQRSVVVVLLLHSYLFVYLFVLSFSLSDGNEVWSSSSFSTRIYLFTYSFLLSLSLSDGNEDKAFTVQPNHGSILLAQPVDCETRSSYNLTLSVTDGVHKDVTWVSPLIIQSATFCDCRHAHAGCRLVCVVLCV